VLHQEHRDPPLRGHPTKGGLEPGGVGGVQSRGGLVEEQNGGGRGQCPTELDQTCHSQRQAQRRVLGELAEVQQLDDLVHPGLLVAVGPVQTSHREQVGPHTPRGVRHPVGEHQVLAHRQTAEQLGVLKCPSQHPLSASLRSVPGDILAVEEHPAAGRADQPREDPEERALAGPVGTDQADDRGRGDGEVHAVDGHQPSEPDGHAGTGQARCPPAGRRVAPHRIDGGRLVARSALVGHRDTFAARPASLSACTAAGTGPPAAPGAAPSCEVADADAWGRSLSSNPRICRPEWTTAPSG
jgi:hypothetical protein